MKKSLSFSIDAAFLTDLARQWFWDEDRPYEKCEELLMCCIGSSDKLTADEKRHICQDIIEGRKKLVGVNECTIEEDGKRIRPISKKLEEQRMQILIREIKHDMEVHPLNYINYFSVDRNIEDFFDEYEKRGVVITKEIVESYFCDGRDSDDNHFYYGLWLFSFPSLIAKLNGGILPEQNGETLQSEFWKKLSDWVDTNAPTSLIEVQKRQGRYRSFMGKEVSEDSPFKSQYGLISPAGKWFNCDFAEHNIIARQYIIANPTQFGFETRDDARHMLYSGAGDALDILYQKGWAVLRNPYFGSAFLSMGETKRLTKAQADTVMDYIEYFGRYDLDLKGYL